MRVVSFYSYKGGTGRTLLLANLGVYAARLGLTVVMVDLDLEAPGLAYKVLARPPARPGVIEWLTAARQPEVAEMAERLEVSDPFNAGGALWLIGAGPPPSQSYLRDVRELQSTVFTDDSATAVAGMLDLRDAIGAQLNPHLLLLDARTGISNTNAITTRVLADDVVALTLNTPEQREGTREVLRSLVPLTKPHEAGEPLGLHIVISRVPDPRRDSDNAAAGTARDVAVATDVRQFLTEPAEPLTSTLVLADDPLLLHEDAAVAAEEHLLLAARTNLARSRRLRMDYLHVAQRLLGSNRLGPAIAQAFDDITETQRLERGEFFGDIEQILTAKAPPVSAEIRPPRDRDRSALKRKVDLLRKAAKEDPARRPDLAAALVEYAWAAFDARTASSSNGLSFLREALRIYSELADRQPDPYAAPYLDLMIQYSAMAAQLGHLNDAQVVAVEAVDFATGSAADRGLPAALVGKAWNNLASIRHGVGQSQLAVKPIQEATRILDAQCDSRQSDTDVLILRASAHHLRAVIEATLGDTAQALHSADTAVGAYRDLLRQDHESAGPSSMSARASVGLGRALSNRANIHRARGQFIEAIEDAREATAVLGDLAAKQPESYLADLALANQTLSLAFADSGEHARALQLAEHAAHLWRDLVSTLSGARARIGLISALNNLAARYAQLDAYDDAIRTSREATDLGARTEEELLSRPSPDEGLISDLRQVTGPTWVNLAAFYRNSNDVVRALDAALEAQRIYGLVTPTDSRTELTLKAFIAECYLDLNDRALAYVYAREAISLAEKTQQVAARAPVLRLAARATLAEDPHTAITYAAEALSLSSASNDVADQALSLRLLADAYTAAGDPGRGEATRQKALDLGNRAFDSKQPPDRGN